MGNETIKIKTSYTLPGNIVHNKELQKKIKTLSAKRGDSYKPRTRHIRTDGRAKYTNRLFLETSPYLLQHAHNPVNWYFWGDEAFDTATRLNLPVFLSIGYSTCHWCHVMEEESFEDEEIAKYLNENYISIKVDREERPDIDVIYMDAVQALTGGGGWPLNVFLTPDQKPFYGGTYFPARDGDRGVGAGFLTIIKAISSHYHNKNDITKKNSEILTKAVIKIASSSLKGDMPGVNKIENAILFYRQQFDEKNGGIIGDIKFPSSMPIRFLLRYYKRTGDKDILNMVLTTLNKMADGGMYDHIGGGFHRYSTDETWLVPHFEKMLYDNALLAVSYMEAFQLTSDKKFSRITREILDYIINEMTNPQGGFYSATDADSKTPSGHMEEGYFFTWTPCELKDILGADQADIISIYYNVKSKPNFEGRYILHTSGKTFDAVAKSNNMSLDSLKTLINESRRLLYSKRKKRLPPLRDEKIITAYNSLMISAFSKAGSVLNEKKYTDTAVCAANFLLNKLYKKGKLYRSYNDNRALHNGYLSDYAFFISSLLDLYETTFDIKWLEKAIDFDSDLEKYFEDKEHGGFFMTSHDHEKLITRRKPSNDGATPSGNSVAVLNLLRLYELTTSQSYLKRAEKALKIFLGSDTTHLAALPEMLIALDFYLDKPKEIVIVTPGNSVKDASPFLDEIRKRFVPNHVLSVVSEKKSLLIQENIIPLVKGKKTINGKVTAYICEKGGCSLPYTEINEFSRQIEKFNEKVSVQP